MPTEKLIKISESVALRELSHLRERRQLSKTARKLGISNNRLTELLRGKRKWSAYFLALFLKEDVLNIPQILQGCTLEDLPREDKLFLLRHSLGNEIIELIAKIDNPEKIKKILRALAE